MDLRIVLTASKTADLADAWERHCGNLPGVTVHRGSILDLMVDAVVSPANSFGFMDGGIDALYVRYFGPVVQERLQGLIRHAHGGELPVGVAAIVPTDHQNIPYLIAAPTMRVPMILGVETVNPYLAARAALRLLRSGLMPMGPMAGKPIGNHIKSLAFPGLGAGVGRVPPDVCARQMRAAIMAVLLAPNQFPRTWTEAQRQHQLMYADETRDLQYERGQ